MPAMIIFLLAAALLLAAVLACGGLADIALVRTALVFCSVVPVLWVVLDVLRNLAARWRRAMSRPYL
jgi:hypothetical protein